MGRGKHCSPEKRKIIQDLRSKGHTYSEIGQIIGCSNKMIRNATTYQFKAETRGRNQRMSQKSINRLIRLSKKEPFMSASNLKKELGIQASLETIRRRLRDKGLNARSPRKVPLLTGKNVSNRLKFAKQHLDWPVEKWRNILWTDESKIVLYGGKGSRLYVRRPQNTAFHPMFTTKTVKHGGSSIMVWASFSYSGVGPIHWIKTIMDQHIYVKILEDIMLPYASYHMPLIWIMQQYNDPKHTSKKAQKWFEDNNITVMEWPAQSPDLNPIENLWAVVKKKVSENHPSNNQELWAATERSWNSIPIEKCQRLVDSMPARCRAVMANKGHATKY